MAFLSTKTYGHEQGLSCVFRQWRATHSHCSLLHGYALSVKLVFACTMLDERNWVMDFGGLKEIKAFLQDKFDHTLVVALDDPEKETFKLLEERKLAKITWLANVGCEAFAAYVGRYVDEWLSNMPQNKQVRNLWLHSCEIAEHNGNSAIWIS